MTRSLRIIAMLPLAMLMVCAGCAKRPVLGQASAPAPTGAVAPTAPPPAAEVAQPSAAPAAERPAPKEFAEVPELRPIHFDFDRYDIRSEDAKILDANADWLKTHADHLVLIEGHCDERGTNEYNMALGERRAKAARGYLVSHGIVADRVTIISYGEERPLCREHDEKCWSQNRRAQFVVKPR